MLRNRFALLALTLACGQLTAQPLFISAEQLKERRSHYQVIDSRGRLAFLSGHIPNAQRIDWKALADTRGEPGDPLWASLADTEKLQNALRQLGLEADSSVVVYADPPSGWGEDGRILWTLKAAGIDSVQLLDGGISAWKAIGGPLNYFSTSTPASPFKLPPLDLSASIDTATLRAHYLDYRIIDSRSAEEFKGAVKFGEARGGHLPGAINIPFETLLNADGTAKSGDAIQALLATHGVTPENSIVTYCTAGIRSAHSWALLTSAGFNNVKNYSNGFYHWAATPALPLE